VSETFPREDNCLKSSSVSCKLQPHRTPAGIGIRKAIAHSHKLGKIMAVEYDLVVIGGGSGGLLVAGVAASARWR